MLLTQSYLATAIAFFIVTFFAVKRLLKTCRRPQSGNTFVMMLYCTTQQIWFGYHLCKAWCLERGIELDCLKLRDESLSNPDFEPCGPSE